MNLTKKQYELLINMFNASIVQSAKSGIPIGQEYWEDIDLIKEQLYQELSDAIRREQHNDIN